MNKPFGIDEETQLAMAKYNAKVVNMIAGAFAPRPLPALSDEDKGNEWDMQRRLRIWIATGFNLINEINEGGVVRISRSHFDDFIHDELPVEVTVFGGFDFSAWDEKINEAAGGLK